MQKKVAIVTGGLSGIGRAIARRLADQGMVVWIGARRGDDPALTEDLRAEFPETLRFGRLDVRDSASCDAFVAEIVSSSGRVDILINAAGIYEEAEMIGHPDQLWDDTLATNPTGTFKMIRAVMPGMKRQSWGRIVNIASVAAHQGMAGNAAYCASKAGLLGLGRCVSLEGAAHGITCTSISPTWVETEMLRKFIEDEVRAGAPLAQVRAKYEASNPQGQLVQPEEIAELAAFLVSDAARGHRLDLGHAWPRKCATHLPEGP